jgi:oligopeptide transport system substrate-binding protein
MYFWFISEASHVSTETRDAVGTRSNRSLQVMARVVAILALVAFLLPSLATVGAAQEAAGDKVLRVRMPFWPETLDPQKTSYVDEIAVSALDYEGLTRLDENLQTVPAAAESWEFHEAGTVVTFHLRDGLVYSDGSPLTAERFRFAIERACDPNTAAVYASILFDIAGCETLYTSLTPPESGAQATPGANVVDANAAYEAAKAALGVRAVDDRTLEVQLTQPAPYFPTVASTWVFYPVKEESLAGGEGWAQDPAQRVGNGPFRMTAFAGDQHIGFAANEHYWAGRPKLDGIEYVYIEDPQVALEAYRVGDLHVTQLGPNQIPEVEADPALSAELLTFPAAVTINLMFDLKQEPFQDQKVREAFAYGFDRETYCAEVRSGDCLPAFSWIPPGVPGHIETEAFAFDPEKAREALAASSYGDPENLPEIKFFYPSDDPSETDRSQWLAQHYRDVLGVELTLEPVDSTTLASMTKDPTTFPQTSLLGWGQDYPDPQNWLSIYWTCGSTIHAGLAGYCNEDFDVLIRQADEELDAERRIALYEEAGQLLVEDVPGVFAYNLATVVVIKPEVTGYQATASDYFYPGQWSSLTTLDVVEKP